MRILSRNPLRNSSRNPLRSPSTSRTPPHPMQIDLECLHDENDDNYFNSFESSLPKPSDLLVLKETVFSSKEPLTKKEFTYVISLLGDKINTLYKLCRYISDQQQKNTSSLQKLVVTDEFSDDFWNVSIFFFIKNIYVY